MSTAANRENNLLPLGYGIRTTRNHEINAEKEVKRAKEYGQVAVKQQVVTQAEKAQNLVRL